jgi:hypothetical protein
MVSFVNSRRIVMSFDTALTVGVIVGAFALFGIALAWAELQTRKIGHP